MRLINADRLKEVFRRNTGHDYSELIDIQPTVDVLDKIRAEIDEQVLESLSDGGDDWFTAEKVNECLDIIDKYREDGKTE